MNQSPPEGAHVAVIGAGVTGALSALELAKAGYRVTLIDAGTPGNGASSRSAACARQQFENQSTVRAMRYAMDYFVKWADNVPGAKETVLSQTGYLFLHDFRLSAEDVRRRVEVQRAAGLQDVKFLTPDQISEQFPYIAFPGLASGTWCPSDGFLDHDRVYLEAIEALRSMGGTEIIFNTAVSGADRYGREGLISHLNLISTKNAGSVRKLVVDFVVNAANSWAPDVSLKLGAGTPPIRSRRRYLYHHRVGSSGVGDMTSTEVSTMPMVVTPNWAYSRPTPDGGLLFGWIHAATDVCCPGFQDQDLIEPGFGATGLTSYGSAVRLEISRWIPDFHELSSKGASVTSGFYAHTPDDQPFISYSLPGTYCARNLIVAAGFSGHGLMMSPFTARLVLELVRTGKNINELDLGHFGVVDTTIFNTARSLMPRHDMLI